jgi:hypothetical protein
MNENQDQIDEDNLRNSLNDLYDTNYESWWSDNKNEIINLFIDQHEQEFYDFKKECYNEDKDW